jgi:hypothetical protein
MPRLFFLVSKEIFGVLSREVRRLKALSAIRFILEQFQGCGSARRCFGAKNCGSLPRLAKVIVRGNTMSIGAAKYLHAIFAPPRIADRFADCLLGRTNKVDAHTSSAIMELRALRYAKHHTYSALPEKAGLARFAWEDDREKRTTGVTLSGKEAR